MKIERSQLEGFLQRLQGAPDPWLLPHSLPRLAEPGMGDLRTLLVAVLAQDQAPVPLARLVADLEAGFGPSLLQAGRLPWDEVVATCARISRHNQWKHSEALPSILLSCADFLVRHPDLRTTLETLGPSDFVRDLAQDIPFTGRSSPWRDRPWRLARWLARGETGLAPVPTSIGRLRVPPAAIARAFRYLGLPVPTHELPVKAWEWSDRICRRLSPEDPTALWVPFMLMRRPRKRLWACQEHMGGCEECPLLEPCSPPPRV